MAIPTVSGSEVVAAPVAAAPVNASALMAPGQGMQSIARGIGEVGQVAQEFQQRRQAAINAAAQADATMQMEKAFNDYQIEMSKMPDPDEHTNAEETWVAGWQKKSQALKDSLLSDPKISQAVKDRLSVDLTHIATESEMRIATQANTRTIQRQKAKLSNVADFMFQNGDKERGDIAIDAMVEHGLIFPEEAYKLKEVGHEKADFQAVNKQINDDPFTALDQLNEKDGRGNWKNFTDLDENKREALKVEAQRATASIRHDTVNDLVDRTNNGEIIGKDELQALVDQKRIKATEMKWILQQQKAGKYDPEMVGKFADILSQIDNYDPVKDPTHQQRAELFGQALQFPPQYRDEIKKELDKKAKGTTGTAVDHQTIDAKRYLAELRQGGFLGDVSTQEGKPRNPAQYQAAYGKELELRQALATFVKENPKADAVQQRDFINGKIRGMKTISAATPILNSISGRAAPMATAPRAITSKAEFDALPSGAAFSYNGKTGVKK